MKYGENEYYLDGLYTESELLEIVKKGKDREKALSDSMRKCSNELTDNRVLSEYFGDTK